MNPPPGPPRYGPASRAAAGWWRWWCVALLLVIAVCWAPRPARAATVDDCRAELLDAAHADTVLRISSRGQPIAEAQVVTTVQVPTTWPYAGDLLLSENSDKYRHAMHCLLRDPVAPGEQAAARDKRPDEWRVHSPQVTVEAPRVKVRYETLTWLDHHGAFAVGPWTIRVGTEHWRLSLTPPTLLRGVRWERVQIDLGGLDAFEVSPTPQALDSAGIVWTGLGPPGDQDPVVAVRVVPRWQRAWTANAGTEPFLGINRGALAAWWVATSMVVVAAARRARRPPTDGEVTTLQNRSSAALTRWGLLTAVMGLALLLYTEVLEAVAPRWLGYESRWQILLGLLVGWVLLALARPRRSVVLAASLVAAAGALVAALPSLFGLPPKLTPLTSPSAGGIAALTVMTAAVQWLWLAGPVLWAWRLLREGGMLRSPATPWRLRRIGPVLAALTLLLLGWAWWAYEHQWRRISWLSDRTAPAYGSQHRLQLSHDLVNHASAIPVWSYAHTWVLTAVGIVALLRARNLEVRMPPANPTRLDCLLLALFFALVVAWRPSSYAGSQLSTGIWLVVDIAAVYGLLAVGRRWAVLTKHLEGYDAAPSLNEAMTEARRKDLIDRARRYRELIAMLRRQDEWPGEGPLSRHAVEKELSGLHRWRHAPGTGDAARPWLPSQVTVVDVALSWGPHAKWWDNARRAALLAAVFGLPGSFVMVWVAYAADEQWMTTGQNPTGVPDLVWMFVSWELTWAGAGLLLGALWRMLPGRRGPTRASSLVFTYALGIGLSVLASRLTDQALGSVALATCLMLLVLTLTGIAMDVDTFRSERRFWPSRTEQLFSIYQLRGFSVHIAYVLAQVATALTILKFFAGSDVRGLKG
ncbi:DUF6185 family protein [Streptomyces sp. FH025]|uniref:DUF6185 family protein n=1 Tax=Streptomyces sp. FH025 TaxID=2815937 RepID=UPI001A9E0CCD|nr:DUF6185 family protein [Streptomyces sp. FH025]MBO1413556.1 hypothetical protein [Streptomyces sp. FH025]